MPPQSRLEMRGPTCRRVVLAGGVALFAHLFVVVHGVSHLADPTVERTASRHCVVCSAGEHAPSIPVAMPASCMQASIWVAGFVAPQAPPTRIVDSAVFARAPPLRAEPVTNG